MANVIKTVLTYQLDGSTRDFNIPFEYLARKFVVVTLIGVDRKVLTLNTDYRFATRTTISLTKAWGTSDGYPTIELRRVTSTTDRLVDFTDGSILRAYDLNVAQIQTMHVAEEARDLTADTIGVNNDGNLDARGRRIVNVADAQDVGDAITLGQVTRWNESALNSKNAAKTSETNAKTSETNAKTSETNAKTSETLAHDWAQKDEDAPVVGSEFSSYHYSRKSSASASASAASAAASLASKNAAKVSEDNAKLSETNAKASEVSAKADADRAEREADKLQNWNALAEAIHEVNPQDYTVVWNGDIVTGQAVSLDGLYDMTTTKFAELDSKTNGMAHAAEGVQPGDTHPAVTQFENLNLTIKSSIYNPGLALWNNQSGVAYGIETHSNNLRIGRCNRYGQLQTEDFIINPTTSTILHRGFHVQAERTEQDAGNIYGGFLKSSNQTDGTNAWVRSRHARNAFVSLQVGVFHDNGTGVAFDFRNDGNLTGPHGLVQWTGSDIRLKDNVKDSKPCALERIEKIQCREFSWKMDGREARGFVAQELQVIDPLYVKVPKHEDDALSVEMFALMADLVVAVQVLSAKVKELESR